MLVPGWQRVSLLHYPCELFSQSSVTETSDTTSMKTTSSSTCPSTNLPTLSEASPSFPSAASTYTRTKSFAASRRSTTATSSPSPSLSPVDQKCSRAISTHLPLDSGPARQQMNGSVVRPQLLPKFRSRVSTTAMLLKRFLLTISLLLLLLRSRRQPRLSHQSQYKRQLLLPLPLVDLHHQ
jgi:hypothetical protein